MAMENLSAVLHDIKDLRMEISPTPKPGKGEVLLAIKKCGICRTDIHLWQEGFEEVSLENPVIIGHECSGQVIKVGEEVKKLKIGDRVAIELGLPCLRCENCRSGRYNLCKPFSLGGLARYHVWPEGFCHKMPDHVTDEEGALMEPLAVAVRSCTRGNVGLGKTVLVGGAGPIGLSCLLAAKAMGASKVCITDVFQSRLDLASRMGADNTVQVKKGVTPLQLSETIVRQMGGPPDVVVETSGVEHSLQTAIHAVKPGGCLVHVGLASLTAKLPLVAAAVKEVDIRGSFSYGQNDYPRALSMVSSGLVDPKPMITHRYDLTNTLAACQLGKEASSDVVKIMIDCEK